jgi:hypothetical protein
MKIVLEVIFSAALVGFFGLMLVLRAGLTFPRFGRWLDKKLGRHWFDGQT